MEKLAAVSDRGHADVLEIVGREFRERVQVYGVVPERLLVLRQAQIA